MKKSICFCLLIYSVWVDVSGQVPTSSRSLHAIETTTPVLRSELNQKGLSIGSPIFIRIFKEESDLELWVSDGENFILFKTYPICHYSGKLGPKTKQGDYQSPEGFYFVNANRMNPWSRFHLSMNLGYPNEFDRIKGYTGSYLMIHGNCVSIGCYAMTDEGIEEIYTVASTALDNGQNFFRVHIFPFRMTSGNIARHQSNDWMAFWINLKEGYDIFQEKRVPPNVEVGEGKYVFN